MNIKYFISVSLLLFSSYSVVAESIAGYIESMEIDQNYAYFTIYQQSTSCDKNSQLRLPLNSSLVALVGAIGSSHLLTSVEYLCDSANNANVRSVTAKKNIIQ